jgi:hypothetical protein
MRRLADIAIKCLQRSIDHPEFARLNHEVIPLTYCFYCYIKTKKRQREAAFSCIRSPPSGLHARVKSHDNRCHYTDQQYGTYFHKASYATIAARSTLLQFIHNPDPFTFLYNSY